MKYELQCARMYLDLIYLLDYILKGCAMLRSSGHILTRTHNAIYERGLSLSLSHSI